MRRYRQEILFFILFIIAGTSLACAPKSSKPSKIPLGNHPGIIIRYGLIAADDEGIYYRGRNGHEYGLYSMKYGESKVRELIKGSVTDINALDGWIYYYRSRDSSTAEGIYRMQTDGSQEQCLTHQKGSCINVAGEWIYSLERDNIWKIKADGSNAQKLYDGHFDDLTTDGEFLFFKRWNTDSLFKGSCDGQSSIENIPGKFNQPFVYKDWIYYCTHYGGIYRMDKNNFRPESLIAEKEYSHYIDKCTIPEDDIIYCSGNYGISRFDIRKKNLDTLSPMYVEELGLRGNYIFFTIEEQDEHGKPYLKAFCMTLDSLKKRTDPKNWLQTYEEFPKHYKESVKRFIDCIKKNDRIELSKMVHYPLHRRSPIPSIRTSDEFLKRFDEVFDKKLIDTISKSDIDRDWEIYYVRGNHEAALTNGTIWIEYDGRLGAINYESEIEKKKRQELLEADRNSLHSSLKDFIKPVLEWKTKKFRIRIDRLTDYNMGNSGDKYRYAAWPINKLPSDKPDLIITNGKCIPDGSGGNHHYEFRKGIYLYRCNVEVLRSWDDPPGRLEVYKQDIFRPDTSMTGGRREKVIMAEDQILDEPVLWTSDSN